MLQPEYQQIKKLRESIIKAQPSATTTTSIGCVP